MAAVDFGDSELFEQLGDSLPVPTHIRFADDEGMEDTCLGDRLEECEEIIQRLTDENQHLHRKLRILTRPSGLKVEDVNVDGPLLQILYANNAISKQCRQEIEDCICSVIQKHQNQGKQNSSFHMQPQNSAFVMEEDQKTKSSSCIKKISEVFSMVGSVMYFTTFSVDKLGQPLLNENPQLTEGWEVPTYEQIFNQVIGTDGQDIEMKEKRPKPTCFNCGLGGHQLRDCPKPKDMAAINERRKEFSHNSNQSTVSNQRYHADEVEERFAKYKPGVLSDELLAALGVGVNTLPPLIYRMRQLGYPPGWLKEAELENSGLALYDGKVANEGAVEDANGRNISYDVSKLVDFPGFNIPAPSKMKDEFMQYGSVPMQNSHMKHNFAAYLSNNYPEPGAICNKRRQDSVSSSQQRKKRRSSPDRSSDMDLDSDLDTSGVYQSPHGFQFQPPLPPGSPAFSSPPPLPLGTPPATPTRPPLPKGTPPATPTNRSPALRGTTWKVIDQADYVEDGLTLEELEEQQRILMAALENADTATNSDCETPALGTPVPSSPSISTSAHVDTESEMEDHEPEGVPETKGSTEANCQNSEEQTKADMSTKAKEYRLESPGPVKAEEDVPGSVKAGEDGPHSPIPVKVEEDSPQSPGPVKAGEDGSHSPIPVKVEEDSPQSPGPVKAEEDSPQSPGPVKAEEDSPQSPGPVKAEEDSPQSPGPILVQEDAQKNPDPIREQEDSPQSPGPILVQEDAQKNPDPIREQEDSPQSPGPILVQEDAQKNPDPIREQEDSPLSPGPIKFEEVTPVPDLPTQEAVDDLSVEKIMAVPHRSRFAAGIVPFEDTPEFTEVAEATGTYLKIRDVLKCSPRNLAKNKK